MNYRGKADLEAVRAFIDSAEFFTIKDIANLTGMSYQYVCMIIKKYLPEIICKNRHGNKGRRRDLSLDRRIRNVREFIEKSEQFSYKDLASVLGLSDKAVRKWLKINMPDVLTDPNLIFKRLKYNPNINYDALYEISEKEIKGKVVAVYKELVSAGLRANTLHFIKIETEEGTIDILTPGRCELTPLEGAVSLKVLAVTYKGITRYKLMEILR